MATETKSYTLTELVGSEKKWDHIYDDEKYPEIGVIVPMLCGEMDITEDIPYDGNPRGMCPDCVRIHNERYAV